MSPRHVALSIAVLFLGLALAGCLGGGGPEEDPAVPGPGGPATFDEGAGALRGMVTDDEGLPVAGAEVGLFGSDLSLVTRTNDDGLFTLSNVAAGQHNLIAQKLGYEPAAQRVTITAGQVLTQDLVLVPLPVQEPWVEYLNHNGQYGLGAAIVRTTYCPSGCSTGTTTFFYFGGFPDDFAGMTVEARWQTSDWFGFDLNTRDGSMFYRVREQSPLRFTVFPCQDYSGPPYYGRTPMPCGEEEYKNLQATSGNAAVRLETWYIGQFQEETHLLDPVCQQPVAGVLPGYEAGCYGIGLAPETRWTTWVSLFHMEAPDDWERLTAFPDG